MTTSPRNYCRRDLLKLSGTALATTTLAGCTTTQKTPESSTDASTDANTNANDNTTSESTPDTPVETTETDTTTYHKETLDTARNVAATVRESTVKISTGKGGGTGWVLNTEKAYIVTNSHVVKNHTEARITTYDDTSYTDTVIGNVNGHIPDAALLKITNPNTFNVPELPLGNDTNLESGDKLVQVGHPFRVGDWVASFGVYLQHNTTAGCSRAHSQHNQATAAAPSQPSTGTSSA